MSLLLKHQLRSWFLTHLGLPVHVSTNLDKSLAIQEPVFSVKLAKCKKNEANQSESYQLVRKHDLPNYVRDVSLESLDGKNELSITLQKDVFTESTLEHCLKNLDNVEAYLKDYLKPQKRIVYDFSSPNIAKPFHYGHLRSTIIGNCLSNIHSFLGHDVTRINYIGDVGKQFGFLSVGYELFGDEEKFIANPLEHLLDVYIKGNEECEKDSKLAQEAKKRAFELEHRLDEQVFLQWQKFREHSINYYKKMYERIGVNFDHMHSESMYTNTALEVVETLEKSGIISIVENNAKAVRLGANQETEIPLITKEGASLYLTRDIAAAIDRKQTFNFDQMNYVVERAQNVHFTNLKGILEHAGFDWYHQLQAVTFGRVAGMSTRRGKLVLLKDVLDEAKFLAMHHIISTKTTKINEEDFDNAADILGISAVIVNDLRMYRRTDYEFDWNKATQYRKTSGIMLQYSYSRLCNLQRNCDVQLDLSAPFDHSSIQCKRSLELLLRLSQFDEKLLKAYHTLEPCEITRFLFDLTFNIGSVYKQLTVKDQVNDVAQSRLRLFLAARAVLYRGMKLLGLKPLSAF